MDYFSINTVFLGGRRWDSSFRFTESLIRHGDVPVSSLPPHVSASLINNTWDESGAFVTADEPTWTPYPHSEDVTVQSWCCTFYRFGQMCDDLYPFLWNLLCPKITLCISNSSPCPQLQATTNLFIVSIVLHFQECHMVELIQYLILSDGLLSLVICIEVSSMFLHALIAHFFLTPHRMVIFHSQVYLNHLREVKNIYNFKENIFIFFKYLLK